MMDIFIQTVEVQFIIGVEQLAKLKILQTAIYGQNDNMLLEMGAQVPLEQ